MQWGWMEQARVSRNKRRLANAAALRADEEIAYPHTLLPSSRPALVTGMPPRVWDTKARYNPRWKPAPKEVARQPYRPGARGKTVGRRARTRRRVPSSAPDRQPRWRATASEAKQGGRRVASSTAGGSDGGNGDDDLGILRFHAMGLLERTSDPDLRSRLSRLLAETDGGAAVPGEVDDDQTAGYFTVAARAEAARAALEEIMADDDDDDDDDNDDDNNNNNNNEDGAGGNNNDDDNDHEPDDRGNRRSGAVARVTFDEQPVELSDDRDSAGDYEAGHAEGNSYPDHAEYSYTYSDDDGGGGYDEDGQSQPWGRTWSHVPAQRPLPAMGGGEARWRPGLYRDARVPIEPEHRAATGKWDTWWLQPHHIKRSLVYPPQEADVDRFYNDVEGEAGGAGHGVDPADVRAAVKWKDEQEDLRGQMEHFSLRVNRIRSARGASAIQSEAVDLELERLRREERAILQRKRQEELDRTRGPVPHWYTLSNGQFGAEMRRHEAMQKMKPQWAELASYRAALDAAEFDDNL